MNPKQPPRSTATNNENPANVVCPFCKQMISEARLEAHKALRCPSAPDDIIRSRPPKIERQPKASGNISTPSWDYLRLDQGMLSDRRAYARFVREQRDGMSD